MAAALVEALPELLSAGGESGGILQQLRGFLGSGSGGGMASGTRSGGNGTSAIASTVSDISSQIGQTLRAGIEQEEMTRRTLIEQEQQTIRSFDRLSEARTASFTRAVSDIARSTGVIQSLIPRY